LCLPSEDVILSLVLSEECRSAWTSTLITNEIYLHHSTLNSSCVCGCDSVSSTLSDRNQQLNALPSFWNILCDLKVRMMKCRRRVRNLIQASVLAFPMENLPPGFGLYCYPTFIIRKKGFGNNLQHNRLHHLLHRDQ
jgi:hypothetical protein